MVALIPSFFSKMPGLELKSELEFYTVLAHFVE